MTLMATSPKPDTTESRSLGIRDRFNEIRERRGMTVDAVASILQFKDANTFTQKLRRADAGSAATGFVADVAGALGCSVSELFGGAPPAPNGGRRIGGRQLSEPHHSEAVCYDAIGVDPKTRAVIGIHNWLRGQGLDGKMDVVVLAILDMMGDKVPKSSLRLWKRALDGGTKATGRAKR